MRLVLLVLAALALLAHPAHAQDASTPPAETTETTAKTIVALLPLDAEERLAIYGQPVAAAIAKALAGTEITLIVVGAKMAVPAEAALIVDGTIEHDKASNKLALALRIRQKSDGATVGGVSAEAIGLPNIDKAASEVSQKLLVDLRALHEKRSAPVAAPPAAEPPPTTTLTSETPSASMPTLFAVFATNPAHAGFRAHLTTAVEKMLADAGRTGGDFVKLANHGWFTARGGTSEAQDRVHALQLARSANITRVVIASQADIGMAFEILDYVTTRSSWGGIPLARARVRVRVAGVTRVLFDRVIVTDSVVGDKGISPDALAGRTAREVVAILGPHLARKVSTWR